MYRSVLDLTNSSSGEDSARSQADSQPNHSSDDDQVRYLRPSKGRHSLDALEPIKKTQKKTYHLPKLLNNQSSADSFDCLLSSIDTYRKIEVPPQSMPRGPKPIPMTDYEMEAILEFKKGQDDPSMMRQQIRKDRSEVKKFLRFIKERRVKQ